MASIAQPRPAAPAKARNPQFRTPVFVAGVAIALLAFLIMFAFGLVFANRSGGGQVRVVVAAEPIAARDPIDPGALTTISVPASAAQPRYFSQTSQLAGSYALVDIAKGQSITANLVASNPDLIPAGTPSYLPIEKGFVAMTLPTGEQQGVAGYIAPGDYIDVIATVNSTLLSPGALPRQLTRTVFSSLHVLRVGPQSGVPRQGQVQGVSSSITVVMSQCDAQYMEWLLVNATLKYTLLSYKDYSPSQPAADATCNPTALPEDVVGPKLVEKRWGFLNG
ncbi:MAG: Flp pilus assembly protein CpaB [Chloroflexi bacterium]|nr:MAG: Flp pilus assembly protein CpaB [Chloroflexota bacterium]